MLYDVGGHGVLYDVGHLSVVSCRTPSVVRCRRILECCTM